MKAETLYFAYLTPETPYLDANGRPLSGAKLTFWRSGTTEVAPVYEEETLETEYTQPIEADDDGVFPAIYLTPAITYRVKLEDALGRLVWDVDPYLHGAPPASEVIAFTEVNPPSTTPPHIFEVPPGVTKVTVLVVAGGAGGVTTSLGGGAGAGGLIFEEDYPVTPEDQIEIRVGGGGPLSGNGQNSSFGALVAIGGGTAAQSGGSGGGGTGAPGTPAPPGSGTPGQGHDGGVANTIGGGGGGGAGEPGHPAGDIGGDGGDGLYFGDVFGEEYGEDGWFAGGGPGRDQQPGVANGGRGGGGKSMPNTGGGAAGGETGNSGIVLVKYGNPGVVFLSPVYQPVRNSRILPGAALKFFADDEIAATYSDPDLSTPLSHPVVANAGGYFPPVYLADPAADYTVQLKDAAGNVIDGPSDNPLPSITEIDPSSADVGDSEFALTVTGTGFVTDSVVRWNGEALATTYVSATELVATVPGAKVADAGIALVSVFNPVPMGGESNFLPFRIANPVPEISSLSPSSTQSSSGAFTLTVEGSGFLPSSVVRWNGSPRATTYVSSTELEAAILADDVAEAGTFEVTVFNPPPGGGTSIPAQLTVESPTTDPDFANVVSLLHFDGTDGSTTITDVIGKTWTVQGNAHLDTEDKKFGSASLLLDGSGDGISTGHSSDFDFGSGDFTIEMWLLPATLTGIPNIIAKRAGQNFAPFSILLDSGRLRCRSSITGSSWAIDMTSTAQLSTESWNHIAYTRQGNTFRQWINGTLTNSGTASGSLLANTDGVYVGRTSNDLGDAYAGRIDDLRITKGVARYTANFTPPSAPFPDQGPS